MPAVVADVKSCDVSHMKKMNWNQMEMTQFFISFQTQTSTESRNKCLHNFTQILEQLSAF